ncbi:SagB family peptide dehydrogenase [Streptomyces sioyaensis]|uniref:SagB family peptide dehydrogenase n=1 Tax=Streptomyces sioyaensis TaxID=67364 RepID=UPI0037D963EC
MTRNAMDLALLAADDGQLLQLLHQLPYLVTTTLATTQGTPVATAEPISRTAPLPVSPPSRFDSARAVFSRFAFLRRLPGHNGEACVLECPLTAFRITLHQPAAAALVAALVTPRPVAEASRLAGLSLPIGEALAALLADTGFLESDCVPPTDDLSAWEFHDLLFHSRSRLGAHDYFNTGSLRPPQGPPKPGLPRHQQRAEGASIDLLVPDWDTVLAHDPQFSQVIEGRRTLRAYARTPLTIDQLGELLYRSARIRQLVPRNLQDIRSYETVDSPCPSAGAMGELDIHAVVMSCDGLEPGVYHYDAAAHQLHPHHSEPHDTTEAHAVLASAQQATGAKIDPQVLLLITSRLGRLAWKYRPNAYALTLKDVGVLYQTLYLTATAMGLAPCALGLGTIDSAGRALGLNWTSTPVVGEFLIGSGLTGRPPTVSGFTDMVPWARATRRR